MPSFIPNHSAKTGSNPQRITSKRSTCPPKRSRPSIPASQPNLSARVRIRTPRQEDSSSGTTIRTLHIFLLRHSLIMLCRWRNQSALGCMPRNRGVAQSLFLVGSFRLVLNPGVTRASAELIPRGTHRRPHWVKQANLLSGAGAGMMCQ